MLLDGYFYNFKSAHKVNLHQVKLVMDMDLMVEHPSAPVHRKARRFKAESLFDVFGNSRMDSWASGQSDYTGFNSTLVTIDGQINKASVENYICKKIGKGTPGTGKYYAFLAGVQECAFEEQTTALFFNWLQLYWVKLMAEEAGELISFTVRDVDIYAADAVDTELEANHAGVEAALLAADWVKGVDYNEAFLVQVCDHLDAHFLTAPNRAQPRTYTCVVKGYRKVNYQDGHVRIYWPEVYSGAYPFVPQYYLDAIDTAATVDNRGSIQTMEWGNTAMLASDINLVDAGFTDVQKDLLRYVCAARPTSTSAAFCMEQLSLTEGRRITFIRHTNCLAPDNGLGSGFVARTALENYDSKSIFTALHKYVRNSRSYESFYCALDMFEALLYQPTGDSVESIRFSAKQMRVSMPALNSCRGLIFGSLDESGYCLRPQAIARTVSFGGSYGRLGAYTLIDNGAWRHGLFHHTLCVDKQWAATHYIADDEADNLRKPDWQRALGIALATGGDARPFWLSGFGVLIDMETEISIRVHLESDFDEKNMLLQRFTALSEEEASEVGRHLTALITQRHDTNGLTEVVTKSNSYDHPGAQALAYVLKGSYFVRGGYHGANEFTWVRHTIKSRRLLEDRLLISFDDLWKAGNVNRLMGYDILVQGARTSYLNWSANDVNLAAVPWQLEGSLDGDMKVEITAVRKRNHAWSHELFKYDDTVCKYSFKVDKIEGYIPLQNGRGWVDGFKTLPYAKLDFTKIIINDKGMVRYNPEYIRIADTDSGFRIQPLAKDSEPVALEPAPVEGNNAPVEPSTQ